MKTNDPWISIWIVPVLNWQVLIRKMYDTVENDGQFAWWRLSSIKKEANYPSTGLISSNELIVEDKHTSLLVATICTLVPITSSYWG